MKKTKLQPQLFSQLLLNWFDSHGRKNLPWQLPRTPYTVWISEIMLQQTQVQTVIPYFNQFMTHFPNVESLAHAQEDEVFALWSGLGYYSRARNLHQAAKIITEQHQGIVPADHHNLLNLPGIGPSTAAAILSQAFNLPYAILDGNVKRVLARFFLVDGWPEQAAIKKRLWQLADSCMPQERCADYTQAIMDLGALCCTLKKPSCEQCPVKNQCQAFSQRKQHLYPTKKIKEAVPTREQQFLVLCDEAERVYLEKRPPTGLWSGLWCFPTIDQHLCPLSFIKERYQLHGEVADLFMQFKHQFSHFRLKINALRIPIQKLSQQLGESNGRWVTQDQLSALGLAKPTSKILTTLFGANKSRSLRAAINKNTNDGLRKPRAPLVTEGLETVGS